MSTPPLGRQSSGTNLETGKARDGDRQDSPPRSPVSPAVARPVMLQRPAPTRTPPVPSALASGGAKLPSSVPVLVAPAEAYPGVRPAEPSSSASPAPSTSSTSSTSSPSTPVTPVKAAYDKGNVSGDQLPEALANVLRASWTGWMDVPKRTDPSVIRHAPVFNLPPKQIARLLVGMESNFYKEPLSGLKVREPLRNKFEIRNFRLNDSITIPVINVIDDILMPFITKSFENADSEAARQAVQAAFEEFATGPHKNLLLDKDPTKSEKASAAQKNLAFRTQFDPVVQPLLDYLLGEKGDLASSGLPAPFKAYIEEVDACYTQWISADDSRGAKSVSSGQGLSDAPASGIPPHLAAKKNALIGAMLTRGLLLAWQQRFMNEARTPGMDETTIGKHFMLLMTHLGHFTTFKLDAFLLGIMSGHEELPPDLQSGLDNLATGAKLKRAEDAAHRRKAQNEQRKQLSRAQTVSDTPRKGGLSGIIGAMLSPRREGEKPAVEMPVSPRSPRVRPSVASTEGLLLKNAESRATTSRIKHRKEIKDYLKSIALPAFDLGYVAFLNKAIERRKNYEAFEVAPAAFCLMQLKAYVKDLNAEPDALPAALEKIAQHLNDLVRKEREAAEANGNDLVVEARPVSGARGAQASVWRAAAPTGTAAPTSTRASTTTTVSSTSAPAAPVRTDANALKLDLSALTNPFDTDAEQGNEPDQTSATSPTGQSPSDEGTDADSAKSTEHSGNQ